MNSEVVVDEHVVVDPPLYKVPFSLSFSSHVKSRSRRLEGHFIKEVVLLNALIVFIFVLLLGWYVKKTSPIFQIF